MDESHGVSRPGEDVSNARETPFGERRRRTTSLEVREKMLAVAHDLIAERGLTVGLEHLRFEDVLAQAGVPRSTAYRVWRYKDDFYVDFLAELAGPEWQRIDAYDQATIAAATHTLVEGRSMLGTPQGRHALLREVVRNAARQNFEALAESASWRTRVALTATLLALTHAARDKVLARLKDSHAHYLQNMVGFYASTSQVLGLRMREPFDLQTLALCSTAVTEGLGLREITVPEAINLHYELRDDSGEPKTWTLAALGLMGVLQELTEDDPDYDLRRAESVLDVMAKEYDPGPE